MGRQPCCDKIGLKRGPWTIEEDHKLMNFILKNGILCWRHVPKLAGLARCGKSCRLRWINYLRPDLKRGPLTQAEEDMIIQLHSRYGNRWSKIASHFPGRTDNEIKNQWNTKIKKKLKDLRLEALTHKPISKPNTINKDENENIQSSSPESQENKTLEEGFGAGENINCFHYNEIWEKPSTSETQPSIELSFGVNGQSFDDIYPQWIDSPDHMLLWDNFNILEDNIFNVPLNLDGTNI